MKCHLVYLFLLISVLNTFSAQPFRERIYVHSDKECYVAGEEIRIGCLVVDEQLRTSPLSKVGYIELCDTQKPWLQVKVALTQGRGTACIPIPSTIPSGIYRLAAYTRYMRNEEEASFFTKQVSIINVDRQSETDRIEVVPAINELAPKEVSSPLITTDKKVYTNREQVIVNIGGLRKEMLSLAISVHRDDDAAYVPTNTKQTILTNLSATAAMSQTWIPEYEGHIVTGRIIPISEDKIEETDYNFLSSTLGLVGWDLRMAQGQMNPDNETFNYYMGKLAGRQEIVASASYFGDKKFRIDILSPFAEPLPHALPRLKVQASDSALMERHVAAQLKHLFASDSVCKAITTADDYYNFHSFISYNLDDYKRFPTLEETIVEFVKGVVVRKSNGKRRIKALLEEEGHFNKGNSLIILDGIPIHDHEDMLAYNPRNIKMIDVFGGKYVFGGEVFECIISFRTTRGDLPAIQLSDNSQMQTYDFPALPDLFVAPNYSTPTEQLSKRPDFRHTLYWHCADEGGNDETDTHTFYTSDLCGRFKITIEGINRKGEVIREHAYFEVDKRGK